MIELSRIAPIVAALALVVPSTSPAYAKQSCGPRDQAMEQLAQKHHEHVAGRGITPTGNAM